MATGSTPFVVDQRLQIAVLTDFCNECGNCVTACPTSGRPYVDKPRLYLDRADFEAQASNAFMLLGGGVIEGRFDGATHRVSVGAPGASTAGSSTRCPVSGPSSTATRSPWSRRHRPGLPKASRLSLEPAAVMATLLAGVTGSLSHIPTVTGGGTRVAPPGLAGPAEE